MLRWLAVLFFIINFIPSAVLAAPSSTTPDQYYRAKVVAITEEGVTEEAATPFQKVLVEISNGDEKGKRVTIDHGNLFNITEKEKVWVGETVVLSKPAGSPKTDFYYIVDTYRAYRVLAVVVFFFVLAGVFGRKKGLAALLGLSLSVAVIYFYILPQIIKGSNPLLVCVIGSLIILFFSLYLSHGFNKRITVALIGTLVTFLIALLFDLVFVYFTRLSGTGTEESFYLQLDAAQIDVRSLLLGGIMIGVLGVLDDVTTTQAATVEEIHLANPALPFAELYRRGISVGREHIASVINTLVLAYLGASFPLFLLFRLQTSQPLWLMFNSNFIAEEVVRTLVGSSALVLAVPITTLLAAAYYGSLGARGR